MLYVDSSIHHQSLNQSWTSLGVSEEGNYQRTVDWGQGHMATLQPGAAHAQSSEEAVQFAGVPGFRERSCSLAKSVASSGTQERRGCTTLTISQ